MKMWTPPDVPTLKRWMRVCRNLDSIEKMKVRLVHDDAEDVVDTGFRFVIYSCIYVYNTHIINFLFLSQKGKVLGIVAFLSFFVIRRSYSV